MGWLPSQTVEDQAAQKNFERIQQVLAVTGNVVTAPGSGQVLVNTGTAVGQVLRWDGTRWSVAVGTGLDNAGGLAVVDLSATQTLTADLWRARTTNLRLQGGPSGASRIEAWNRLSVSGNHAFGNFPDPGEGSVYADGSLQARIGLTVTGINATAGTTSPPVSLSTAAGNSIALGLGTGGSVSGYGTGDWNGGVRFYGSGLAHGDVGYFPNGGNLGEFRFGRSGVSAFAAGSRTARLGAQSLSVVGRNSGSAGEGFFGESQMYQYRGDNQSGSYMGCAYFVGALPGNAGLYYPTWKSYASGVTNYHYFDTNNVYSGYHNSAGWVATSDERQKKNFRRLDPDDLLARIRRLPVTRYTWDTVARHKYAGDDQITRVRKRERGEEIPDPPVVADPRSEHDGIGPTAQDFNAVFPGLQPTPETNPIAAVSLNPANVAGVALGGVQALLDRIEKLENRIAQLEKTRG